MISLKKLIVRKVAHDEKGLFLISMGGNDPEMVEVLTNTKEERDSWIDTIQETMTTMYVEVFVPAAPLRANSFHLNIPLIYVV